jgi:hypothetical protein
MKAIAALILLASICSLTSSRHCSAAASGQTTDQLPWGQTNDGLQLSLSSTHSNSSELHVALRNVGDRDETVNLGYMLANGKVQLPSYLSLNFTDAQGKARQFKFADKKYSNVAGRLDDYIVPLRAGSMYTLTVRLDQFWSHETNEFAIALLPGKNLLTAQLEGRGAKFVNLDMPAVKLMNFWVGKVESNTLVLERQP